MFVWYMYVVCAHVYTGENGTGMKNLLPTINSMSSQIIVLPVHLQKGGALWLSMILVRVKNWQVINSRIFLSIAEKIRHRITNTRNGSH